MKVRRDVDYCVNYTLTGKILLVGIREINSFMKIDRKYASEAKAFIDKYRNNDIEPDELSETEARLFNSFNRLGYLDNGVQAKTAFNEFKTLGKELVTVRPNDKKLFPKVNEIVKLLILLLSVIAGGIYIFQSRALLPKQIDYIHMRIWEIVFTITLYPGLVMGLHEVGHCFVAKLFGVKIKSVSIGWFYICPLLLVQYFGLNLEKQYKKIAVMLGGVYFNYLLAIAGIIVKALWGKYIPDAVIDIWISAHFSLIITNLGLYGMTDGYYIVSNIIGIMNIRLKGYNCLNSIVRKKTLPEQHDVQLCGVILLALFGTSVISVYANVRYWLNLLSISSHIFEAIFLGIVIALVLKFALRVRDLSFT